MVFLHAGGPAHFISCEAQRLEQQPHLTLLEHHRRARRSHTQLVACLGQVQRRTQHLRSGGMGERDAAQLLSAFEQSQLALLEPQPQGAPPVILFVPRLAVVGHLERRPPDQRWTTTYTTPLRPANRVPMARFLMKYSSIVTSGPLGGAMELAVATTIASNSEAKTPAMAPR